MSPPDRFTPEELRQFGEDAAQQVVEKGKGRVGQFLDQTHEHIDDLIDPETAAETANEAIDEASRVAEQLQENATQSDASPARGADDPGRQPIDPLGRAERATDERPTSERGESRIPESAERPAQGGFPDLSEIGGGNREPDPSNSEAPVEVDEPNPSTEDAEPASEADEIVSDADEADRETHGETGDGLGLDLLESLGDLIGRGQSGGLDPTGGFEIETLEADLVTDEQVTEESRRIRTDLEVLDVRFLDLGDTALNLGPRFRVTVHNHNNKFGVTDVELSLVAGIDLGDDAAPRTEASGVLSDIGPDQIASLDIRLSREALSLKTNNNESAQPFAQLAIVADPNEQLDDINPDNNVMVLNVDEVQHADLKLLSAEPAELTSEGLLTLTGEGFDFEPGTVALVVHGKAYSLDVAIWSPARIVAQLPRFSVRDVTAARLVVVRPDREYTQPLEVRLSPLP